MDRLTKRDTRAGRTSNYNYRDGGTLQENQIEVLEALGKIEDACEDNGITLKELDTILAYIDAKQVLRDIKEFEARVKWEEQNS